MKVSTRLTLGFGIVLIIAIAVGCIGIAGLQTSQNNEREMYEKNVKSLEYVGKAVVAYYQMRMDGRSLVISSFYDDKKGAIDSGVRFAAHAAEFQDWMQRSKILADTPETIRFHDEILDIFLNQYLPVAMQNNNDSIDDIPDHVNKLLMSVQMASISAVSLEFENLLIGLVELYSSIARQSNINNMRHTQNIIILQISLLAAAVITAVVVAFFIIKSIAVPINESSRVLHRIAEGDFSARVVGRYKGDFETIKNSVNETAFQLSVYLDEKINAERSAHESNIERARVEAASDAVFAGISYASRIQRNTLPPNSMFENAFLDYSIIWQPRDIVGGDIYWLKSFDDGALLCVCDCTGHGTSGALLTMLVISALESVVSNLNYKNTADILWHLDKRIAHVFGNSYVNTHPSCNDIQDGCDIAILFAAKDGSVSISSGNTRVFVCNGYSVEQIKGQKISVGEGAILSPDDITTFHVNANPDNKFYIASDGLFDQPGGDSGVSFGYKRFCKIILDNHNKMLSDISNDIWDAFERYRGTEARVDDFELIAFKPVVHSIS